MNLHQLTLLCNISLKTNN